MILRALLQRYPRFLRLAWTIRILAYLGPWHPLFLAYCRKYSNNPRIPASPSILTGLDPSQVRDRLERDGWAACIPLPAALVDRIVLATESCPEARYDNPHRDCDALREFACDAGVLEVARLHLGGEPILHDSVIWRSRKVKNPENVENSHLHRFHFDVADIKSLVLFVYLSEVKMQNGPHVVISGTHRYRRWRDTLRIYLSDQTARERYQDKIIVITGERGTAFFEEQTVYHKQMIPDGPRIMLRITYTLWRVPGHHRVLPSFSRCR